MLRVFSVALFITIIVLCTSVFAQIDTNISTSTSTTTVQTGVDYSNIKGDYSIFCLGDQESVVADKVKYLMEKKIITQADHMASDRIRYTSTLLQQNLYIFFDYNQEGKLVQIFYGAIIDNSSYIKDLYKILKNKFGNPSYADDFVKGIGNLPAGKNDPNSYFPMAQWVNKQRIVDLKLYNNLYGEATYVYVTITSDSNDKLPWEYRDYLDEFTEEPTPDYSQVKGDYKIFCFGDSREITKDKIAYLISKKEAKKVIRDESDVGKFEDFYITLLGRDTDVYLNFLDNELSQITLRTKFKYYTDPAEVIEFVNNLYIILKEKYGEPTSNIEFNDSDLDSLLDKNSSIAFWDLSNTKINLIGRSSWDGELCYFDLIYSSNEIETKAKIKEEKANQELLNKAKKDL